MIQVMPDDNELVKKLTLHSSITDIINSEINKNDESNGDKSHEFLRIPL